MASGTTTEVETATGTILVVDDELSMREMLSIVLRREGYDVVLADRGKTAVEILRRRPVDLLISDIRMPDMDGVEVLRAAKQIDDAIICIMITAFKSTESAVEALRLGAHDYLDKPFDIEQLKKKVRRALERRRPRDYTILGDSPKIKEIRERIQARGAHKQHDPNHGGIGHRQRVGRARHPRPVQAFCAPVHCAELRCVAGGAAGIRAVRSREGGVHQRRQCQEGAGRGGGTGQPLPRRDRAR